MKRKINKISICVVFLILGLIITIQINNLERSDGVGLISINEVKNYEEQLQKIRADKKLALQNLQKSESEIEIIEKDITSKEASLKLEMENLENYKMSAGLFDVKGPGIIITIEDPDFKEVYSSEKESVIVPNYNLLISLVNILKKADAEAISINGQRIIATTEFNFVGNAFYINTAPTAPPYIIKAIGDSISLKSQLEIRYGILDTMRNQYDLRVNLEEKKELQILRYYGDLKFKYAKPLNEMQKDLGDITENTEEVLNKHL